MQYQNCVAPSTTRSSEIRACLQVEFCSLVQLDGFDALARTEGRGLMQQCRGLDSTPLRSLYFGIVVELRTAGLPVRMGRLRAWTPRGREPAFRASESFVRSRRAKDPIPLWPKRLKSKILTGLTSWLRRIARQKKGPQTAIIIISALRKRTQLDSGRVYRILPAFRTERSCICDTDERLLPSSCGRRTEEESSSLSLKSPGAEVPSEARPSHRREAMLRSEKRVLRVSNPEIPKPLDAVIPCTSPFAIRMSSDVFDARCSTLLENSYVTVFSETFGAFARATSGLLIAGANRVRELN